MKRDINTLATYILSYNLLFMARQSAMEMSLATAVKVIRFYIDAFQYRTRKLARTAVGS